MGSSSGIFIDTVKPSIAILQYGYKKGVSFRESLLRDTLRRYALKDIPVYRTDDSGAIIMESDGLAYSFETIFKNPDSEAKVEVE